VKLSSFQVQSLATVLAVYLLIVIGGFVTSTGSGMACPDWPLCHGQIIPPMTYGVIIEFTHRVWTVVATLFVVGTAILAWRKYGWPNKVTAFATLTFLLLVAQVVLGMVTVQSGTHPAVVASHLALATLVFASALATSAASLMAK